MTLKTKCILTPPASDDGFRISVMSRHTLSDGITPDSRIRTDMFDWHCTALAPPSKLLGDYYRRWLPWTDFEKRFLRHLQDVESHQAVEKVIRKAESSTVTLLCIEEKPHRCHRRLLAEACQIIAPRLAVIIE